MKSLALVTSIGLLSAGLLNAQETSHAAFAIGGGFTQPLYAAATQLNEGWNVGIGAGWNFTNQIGAMIDVNYNHFGDNNYTLNSIGVPGGNVGVLSATFDPIIHLTPKSHVDLYITGGGGIYHRYDDFTAPTTETFTGYNPFFGFYPVTVGTNAILSSYSVNKPGVDAGAGIAFGTKWHGKVFAEARWNRIFMGQFGYMDYIPVTFGFRW